jgi:RND family efflux transporter MFP subunit
VVDHLPDEMDIGRRVTKNEVLLRLAVPELEADRKHKESLLAQARKQKVQAEEARAVAEREVDESQRQEKRYVADYTFQRLKHERMRELVRRGAQELQLEQEARQQMDAADAALQAARAQIATRRAKVRAAAADLEVAEHRIQVAEAEVEKLRTAIAFATVQAPFNGVITRRWVDPGATIKDPAAPLFTIMQLDRVRVLVDVPQRDVALVNTTEHNPNPDGRGDPAVVRIPALAGVVPDGQFKGHVTRMSRALDPVTRTMRAEIELDNRAGYLRPGMFGSAVVVLEERSGVLTVPSTALTRQGENKVEVFYVADAKGDPLVGSLERTDVDLGLDDGQLVEIRKGLTGSELVVLRGNGVMRAHDKVIAVPTANGDAAEPDGD